MTETTTGPWHDYLAEADRLREINADLLAALEAIAAEPCDHSPTMLCPRITALTAVKKARGIGQNIDTRA